MEQITELDKTKMNVLKEVADSNVLVGQLKAELVKLEREKETFFVLRENKLIERIKALLENSRGLLEDTKSNYAQVHQFHEVLKGFAQFLREGSSKLFENITEFNEKSAVHESDMLLQTKEISEAREKIRLQNEGIERDKGWIEDQRKILADERKKGESQQAQIKAALEVLKKKQKNG